MIDRDRFWNLLPEFHRRRDTETGGPLRALLEAFSEQAALIEADIARQYDNWFIETCEDWVVPYIGDLIGYTPVHDTGEPDAGLRAEDQALRRINVPRSEVANTIRYRRRKGTLDLLERLSEDVAGWPAQVVEFRHHLFANQHIRRPRPTQAAMADIRGARPDQSGGPADSTPRLAEMRRISAASASGRFGMHQVGLFVARHVAVPVTQADAACIESVGSHCFTFSPLGVDAPLYRPGNRAEGVLPGPLGRRDLLAEPGLYGEGRSLMVWRRASRTAPLQPVAADSIVPSDLRRWNHRPAPGKVALDPASGRLMFPEREAPDRVVVSGYEGTMGDLGAGERPRRLSPVPPARAVFKIRRDGGTGLYTSLRAAIEAWRTARPADALIEIQDSGTYDEHRLALTLGAGQRLEIRAAARTRPLLRIADSDTPRDDAWRIDGGADSALVLDGLLLSGRGLQLRGALGSLLLRRCTLLPGWGIAPDESSTSLPPSLIADNSIATITIQHSILGPIHVRDDALAHEPVVLRITDSVIDGADQDAIVGPGAIAAHVMLTMRACTVLGRSLVHEVALAQDCLFTRRLMVARRQRGCVRFCYLPRASRTPARFNCLPATEAEAAILAPVFASRRFGQPGYCQLSEDCPAAIRRGASDESELGVFHNLFGPQREANLLARLSEFVPATVDVGVIHVT